MRACARARKGLSNRIERRTTSTTITLKSVESEAIETAEILMDMNSIGTHGAVSVSDDEDDDTAFAFDLKLFCHG